MKLHELLAIESNLEGQANKCRTDLANTFEKKRHHFEEKRVMFFSNEEDTPPVVESQSDIQTTVRKELDWVQTHLTKLFDASYRVSEANQRASADVVLEDGSEPILTGVPATTLLELEKRLVDVKNLVAVTPTLDPAKGFTDDDQRGEGYYKAREVTKTRTKKTKRAIVLYNATPEHPAQTALVDEDVPVGKIQEQEWSSMLTVSEKAEMLERAEALIRAVRRARSKANEVEVNTSIKLGSVLLGYIFRGK